LLHLRPCDSETIVDDVGRLTFHIKECLFFRHERDLNEARIAVPPGPATARRGMSQSIVADGSFLRFLPLSLHAKSLELLPSRAQMNFGVARNEVLVMVAKLQIVFLAG
jgi:hypothetical protein